MAVEGWGADLQLRQGDEWLRVAQAEARVSRAKKLQRRRMLVHSVARVYPGREWSTGENEENNRLDSPETKRQITYNSREKILSTWRPCATSSWQNNLTAWVEGARAFYLVQIASIHLGCVWSSIAHATRETHPATPQHLWNIQAQKNHPPQNTKIVQM